MTRPSYNPDLWPFVRVCQSCLHKQLAKDPATYKSDSWRELACKKCHSIDLDYGSTRPYTPEQIAEYDAYTAWENEHEEG